MTDTPDLRTLPLPDALRWLREHGEPADASAPHLALSRNFAGSADALADPYAFPGLGRGEGFPPTMVVVCELDGLQPSGEAFADLLRASGADVTLSVEAGADHGHIDEPADPSAHLTVAAIVEWIRR